ncbi:MAG: hypothetical protein IPP29_09750 [Bacteroidetes bacterium]|nr:hypothetical protein [Bacteroidota bacterium]
MPFGSNWSHGSIASMSNDANMQIFELIYAVMHDVAPLIPKATYDQILNTAPCTGGYYYEPNDNDPNWQQSSRWNHPFYHPTQKVT